jgi:hypothetical protein
MKGLEVPVPVMVYKRACYLVVCEASVSNDVCGVADEFVSNDCQDAGLVRPAMRSNISK